MVLIGTPCLCVRMYVLDAKRIDIKLNPETPTCGRNKLRSASFCWDRSRYLFHNGQLRHGPGGTTQVTGRPPHKDFPLIGNPTMVVTLIAGYLYVVKVWGPRYMEDRKAYDLKHIIMVYNACMVMLNTFFFYKFLSHSYLGGGYSWICQGIDFKDPGSIAIVSYCWCLVVWNGWLFITFGADGQGIMGVCINSFIHIVMYTYYFLAALGPSVQKYLWWKKYITTMQIVQFAVFIAFVSVPLFKDCGYPRFLTYLAASQCFFFLVLFVNFYIHTYVRTKRGEVHFFCGNYEATSRATVPLKEGEKGMKNGMTVIENGALTNGNGHVNGYINGVGLKKREVKIRTH
ncbi:hypothetical protein HPB51_015357 [Rhipicephalus microplus]|uniref:Elongation of very long chain fatty acids protein n=1 Tax=Rhipicephalus microplus TaxID=6941 RepID=A0A9J6DWD4_RHIMP|nr:hypothetical protein HPB51_015357 [Rhipicephalus microplus]